MFHQMLMDVFVCLKDWRRWSKNDSKEAYAESKSSNSKACGMLVYLFQGLVFYHMLHSCFLANRRLISTHTCESPDNTWKEDHTRWRRFSVPSSLVLGNAGGMQYINCNSRSAFCSSIKWRNTAARMVKCVCWVDASHVVLCRDVLVLCSSKMNSDFSID